MKVVKHKTKTKLLAALRTWVVIYPSITGMLFLFGRQLATLPLYQRTFILTASLVPFVVFIGVPFVDFIGRILLSRRSICKD